MAEPDTPRDGDAERLARAVAFDYRTYTGAEINLPHLEKLVRGAIGTALRDARAEIDRLELALGTRTLRIQDQDKEIERLKQALAGKERETIKRAMPKPAAADNASRGRHLLAETADYWFQASRDQSYSLAERMLWLENALNHTENSLVALVEDPTGERSKALQERLANMRARPDA